MKVAIIGGGASGLACAIELLKNSKSKISVTVFEQNERVGKKLLSTGNGRCNMTNLNAAPHDYFDAEYFVAPAFEKFSVKSNLRFFEELGMYTYFDEEVRVYPRSNQASSVLDSLRLACARLGVQFVTGEKIEKITNKSGKFVLNGNSAFDCVVICTGSKASVKAFNGYELLKMLGITVTKTAPSLVKLSTTANETKTLKGVRARVVLTLKIKNKTVTKEKGEILFGDNVLSGIASMGLSPYISRHFFESSEKPTVLVDFVSVFDYENFYTALERIIKSAPNEKGENLLLGFMPKKIGEVILKKLEIPLSSPLRTLDKSKLKKLVSICKAYPFEISGVKSFSEAQVVTGGAGLREFNPKTLESKKIKGLYCAGEVLDVDGPCGGYNLQWAWSSGRLCASSILNKAKG